MTNENYYEGIKHVVHISTGTGTRCEHCDANFKHEEFADPINHYIEQHGYRLLHVGTETIDDEDGNPWHTSVAVLGVEKTLPKWQSNIIGIKIGTPEIPKKKK